MNMPVAQAPQLPAHLMDFGGISPNLGLSVVGGINVGQAHPRVSIKQNRFRLIDAQGEEFLINALYMDVIIVGANDYVSKMYYDKPFDPQDPEPPAPTCFSDNGVGPSERANTPQNASCQGCPHGVWGSKVTPSGAKIKACSDSKKLAIIHAENPTGPVYELRIPAASMENLKAQVEALRGVPVAAVVMRVTFDATSSYPKLLFAPASYISEEQKAAVLEVIGGEEVDEAAGRKDVVRNATQPLPAPQPAPVTVAAPAPAPMAAMPQFSPPQPPMAPPVVPVQTATAATQFVAQNTAAKRTRRTKEQIAADQQQQTAQAATPPTSTFSVPAGLPAAAAPHPVIPQFVAAPVAGAPGPIPPVPAFLQRDVPGALAPAASVPLQPQPTDAALDNILGNAMVR